MGVKGQRDNLQHGRNLSRLGENGSKIFENTDLSTEIQYSKLLDRELGLLICVLPSGPSTMTNIQSALKILKELTV